MGSREEGLVWCVGVGGRRRSNASVHEVVRGASREKAFGDPLVYQPDGCVPGLLNCVCDGP